MITVDFAALPISVGNRILDIGCGSGRHTAEAGSCKKVVVVGCDPNFGDLMEARQRLAFHRRIGAFGGGTCTLASADIMALPFAPGSFDIVVCSEVLEHVRDDRKALLEIRRVLRPGGNLIVSVPRLWPETLCWLFSSEYRRQPGGHLRIYNPSRLSARIAKAGFCLWRRHNAHSLHTPYWWLKCLLGLAKDGLPPIKLYHRLLTWDMMQKPRLTSFLDRLLNPLMGKSVVFYFKKNGIPRHGVHAGETRLAAQKNKWVGKTGVSARTPENA